MHVCQFTQEGSKLIRLWIHEVYRVFSDRLIEEKDKVAFFEIVKERTKDLFQKSVDEVGFPILCTLCSKVLCSLMIAREYESESFGYETSFVCLVLLGTMYQVLKNFFLCVFALLYFHLAPWTS